MRQLYTLILSCMLSIAITSSATAQASFKDYLQSIYPTCFTPDGSGGWIIDPTCTAITQEDSLDFSNMFSSGTYDMFPIDVTDLQYFTNLKYLNASNNHINSIFAFPPTLEKLLLINASWSGPNIGPEIAALPATLLYFDCNTSWMSGLPALPPALRYFNCTLNKLTSLPAFPASLDTIICSAQLDYEQVAPVLSLLPTLNSGLLYLDCSGNRLSTLPTLPASLKNLICGNQWVRGNPEQVYQTLSSLPALPSGLEYLNCERSILNTLPALPASLRYLYCGSSRWPVETSYYYGVNEGISVLPRLPTGLLQLSCTNSNLDCLPHLPASLQSLSLDRDRILCLPNAGSYVVGPGGPAIPICAVTNNINQCTAEAVIAGDIYFDFNSNGVKDPQENFCSNIPVNLSNGLQTFTDNNGHYNIYTLLGNYNLTVPAPPYFDVSPASTSYSLSTYDTSVTALIALRPNAPFDTGYVHVIPDVARPGFAHNMLIKFENVGTTIVDADIVFTFDANKLNFVSASNPSVVHAGNQLTLHVSNLIPRAPAQYSASFIVYPTVMISDTIITYASITANSNISRDSSITIVTGSYDPNDKAATPILSVDQVSSGTFINYLVRFQNTGTDTAFTIVVTDTLNPQLNSATFEMVGASHTTKTTRDGNKLSFEFINIQLPDSNINEPLSHGYIQYRVKPLQSVSLGAMIPNTAAIYFDFNVPVITNVANTNIENANPVPLTLLSFNVFKGENDIVLTMWQTENEINVDHFELQKSTDARSFVSVKEIAAQGRAANNYTHNLKMTNDLEYYRLKIVDADGRFMLSDVIPLKRSNTSEQIFVLNNPASGQLNIVTGHSSVKPLPAVMFNSSGKSVMQFSLSGGFQAINISTLAPGIYFLRAGAQVKKILVR